MKTKPGAAAGIGSASTANKRPRESSPSGGPGGSSAFAQLKKFRESLEKSHEKGTLLKEAGGGGATASAAANMPKSHQVRKPGKTQFVLFGRMQFVLKVCSMHEVVVCSTWFSLFYQKTVG